jgi:hypothetical protein
MPLYDFEDLTTGERVEMPFPMRDAPSIGAVIDHEGRQLKRLASPHVAMADKGFTPFISEQMAENTPGFKKTPDGRCIVESKKQLDNHIARHNDSRGARNGRLKWTK